MPVCTLAPSVDQQLIERLEWLTDVRPSHNGKEQRSALRANPRRSFDFSSSVGDDAHRARAENFMARWHGSSIGLPIWPDRSRLAAPLAAGATSIPVSTAGKDFVNGGQVALVRDYSAEVATISGVASNALTVPALANNWPAGSDIVPLRPARLDAQVGTTNPWPAVLTARVQFLLDDAWPITAASESADYQGSPVVIPEGWALDSNTDFSRLLDVFDADIGQRAVFDLADVEFAARQYHVPLPSKSAIADFYAWLAARCGRLNPFWLASRQRDMTPVANIGASDTTIDIASIGYVDLGAALIGRRDIVIQTVAGAKYYRRITNASTISAATERITVSSALGAALSVSAIASISFMRLSRLASDSIEIAHQWPGVAQASLAVASLRDDL